MRRWFTEIWQQETACMLETIYVTLANIVSIYRIDFNMVIKVADFGLAVNIGAKEYYRLTKHTDVKLPLMWMAPESLSDYMFSEMSDVVSHMHVIIMALHFAIWKCLSMPAMGGISLGLSKSTKLIHELLCTLYIS